MKNLSNQNVEELGRKRGFINYLHELTAGNEYAINITGEEERWLNRARDSKLLNMMQDTEYKPRLMQEHLSIPVVVKGWPHVGGEFDEAIAKRFLEDDDLKQYVRKSTDAEGRVRYFPSSKYYESPGRRGINDGSEDFFLKHILNNYIRDNDLNDENYTNEKALETATDIIDKENKDAEIKYTDYQEEQKKKKTVSPAASVDVDEETTQWKNPLLDKKDLVGRISITSTEEGLARILKDGQEITGSDGLIKVKGVRAEGDKLVVESNIGEQDFGYFEKKNGAYVFAPGPAYQIFLESDAVTQEDKDIFDAFLFGVQNDNRFADGVMNTVAGGEGAVTGEQLYESLNVAPDGWDPNVTVTPVEKTEGFYAIGSDGTVYWNSVDPKNKDKRVVIAFGDENEFFKHRKANGFKEDFSGIDSKVEGSEYISLYNDARTKKRNTEKGIVTSDDANKKHNENLDLEQDEKFHNEANNALTMLKVAGGTAGLGLAMKTLPIGDAPELGAAFKAYMNKMDKLSESGLSAEEMASAKNDLAEAYHIGTKNVLRASGGSRGTFLANMGMLNANRVNGLLKLSAMNQTVKRQNLQQLGQGLKLQESLNNRSGEISRRMAYEEELRKSNIKGAIGSSLIGSALEDLSYAHAKRDGQNLNSLTEENIWQKLMFNQFKVDTKDDIQIVDPTETKTEK